MRMRFDEEKPIITILLATYNGGDYLPIQLDSILNQTYHHWRVVVSDDGSTDQTVDILAGYQKKYPDKFCLLETKKPLNSARDNFFHLINHCDRGYVMFCDQDDVWYADKIVTTLGEMMKIEDKTRPALVFTDLEVVDANLNVIAPSFMRFSKLDGTRTALRQLLVQNVVTGCTSMANESLLYMMHEVQDSKDIRMHDWWLALIASSFGEVSFLDRPTMKYRQHASNTIGAKDTRKLKYLLKKVFAKGHLRETLRATAKQATRFEEVYGDRMPVQQRNLIKEYSMIYSKRKLARIWCIYKNRIFKYGLVRKIAQMIWG